MTTLPPNARFGRLRIERLLGEGGMGAVYAAVDDALGRRVALKVLLPGALGGASASEGLERFRREARAAAAVQDAHVVTLLGLEVEPRIGPGLVFELVPGGSLKDRLKGGARLSWREAARLCAQAARGLAAIHAAGLVHRDVKPHNLLVDAQGTVKVSDLGLVRASRPVRGADSLTATGSLLGTFEYLAPEAQDEAPVGPPADLYGLGATLFHLVAGRPPFEQTGFSLLRAHAMDPPPSLRAAVSDVPPGLDALVLRLLQKAPAGRGAAAEVAVELEALARPGTPGPPPPGRSAGGSPLAAALVVAAAAGALALAIAGRALLREPGAGPADVAPVTTPTPSSPTPPSPTPPSPPPPSPTSAPISSVTLRLGTPTLLEYPPELADEAMANRARLQLANVSLSPDGRLLVLGGACNRPLSYILDAVTLQVLERLNLALARCDPADSWIYAADPAQNVVALRLTSRGERRPLWTRPRLAVPDRAPMPATVAVVPSLHQLYVGWQGVAPDPVEVLIRETGAPVELLADIPAGAVLELLAAPNGVYGSFHVGPQEEHRFLMLARSGRDRPGIRPRYRPGAVRGDSGVLAWHYEDPGTHLELTPNRAAHVDVLPPFGARPLCTRIVAGAGALAAWGDDRVLVAITGGLQLWQLGPAGEVALVGAVSLPARRSGTPCSAHTLFVDEPRGRAIALADDPNGYATRVIPVTIER